MRTGLAGRRKWVALGAAVVVAAGAVGVWALVRPDPSQATPPTIVATATVGTVRQTVSTTGTLAPARQANLSFTVSGTVTSVPVSVGEQVAVGSTLATLNTDDLRTSVDLAQASVVAAQAQVTSSAGSSAAQQASASAQLAAANSSLAQAKANLAAATLTSPITGTVAAVNLTPGDTVGSGGSSGGSSGSGSTGGGSGSGSGNGSSNGSGNGSSSSASSGSSSAEVVVISNGAWIVNASVGAADLAQVHKGLQVEIAPDGTAQRVFGTVSTVGVMATSTSGTAAFPVTIKVTGSPAGLYAGGTVSAQIVVKQLDNVLTVPTAAVSADTSGTYVMVSKGGKQVRTPVSIGAVYGGQTQISSGISEGAQVVVRQLRLPAGGTVGNNQRQRGQFGGGGFNGGPVPGGAVSGK